MEKYDVIVIGAGPSGSTTARSCARYGLSTLLIDKNQFPRDKPCGGAISTKATKELDFKIDEVVQQVYYEGNLFRPKGDFFTIKSSSPLAVGVLRKEFDNLLVQKALLEGVIFKDREKVNKVIVTESSVDVSCEGGFSATGDVLVGADGANSLVAEQVGIRQRWCPDEVGLACVSELRIGKKTLGETGFRSLEFHLGATPAGYGWVFPKGDYLSVGAGTLMKELHCARDMFPDFIHRVEKLRRFKIANPKWHLVPIGGRHRQISKNRVLLVGDAAGLVDPLVGEGISYSIASGSKAAISIKEALEIGNPKLSSAIYDRSCNTLLKDLSYAYLLARRIYYHPDLVLSPFVSDEKLGDLLAEVLKGNNQYSEFIIDVLERLPISFCKKFFEGLSR